MSDPFMKDVFAEEWERFCDADPTEDPDFIDHALDAGLVTFKRVNKEALQEAFAAERGIIPGGEMYVLTKKGARPSDSLQGSERREQTGRKP